MKELYIERIYAGWLAKIIGIRYGAPIEGWTYEKIRDLFGERMPDYPADYRLFAADDDSNGPWFFLRALEGRGRVRPGRTEAGAGAGGCGQGPAQLCPLRARVSSGGEATGFPQSTPPT